MNMLVKVGCASWLMAVSVAVAAEKNPATDWMAEAKVGAFMHFLPGASNFQLADTFDVQAVAKQLADVGVRYFDGGYEWVGFNPAIARVYAEAVRHGNPQAVATFNPGVSLKRWTDAEDYTAGELNDPFEHPCGGRWLQGSQWHVLTFMGKSWGARDTRHPEEAWAKWVGEVTAKGGAVTLDLGPNYDASVAPVGTFSDAQMKQLRAIVNAARK